MLKLLAYLFAAGKLGKVALTGGTMLLSVFAYSLIYGWRYAAGFVILLFVHEMGHFFAAKQRGLDVGLPTFIPFIGAWIQLKDIPHDIETEAYIGIAGPFIGTLAALLCYFVARNYDSNLLLAISYAGFFLNLFNLIPLAPFDGGRIVAIVSPRLWFVGVPILVAMFFWRPSPMLILVALLAAPQVWKAWKYDANAPENQQYYGVSTRTKMEYSAYYLLLVLFLAVMTHDVHEMLAALHAGRGSV
jgi:Zn-dependent protease